MDYGTARKLLVWMLISMIWCFIFGLSFWVFFANILATIVAFSILYFAASQGGGPGS